MWRTTREQLAAHGIRSSAIDLPGHGVRIDERFRLDEAIAAVDAGVRALPSPVVLVGFSLGGYLAIEYAGRRPGTIAALVAASCGTQPTRMLLEGYRLVARAIHTMPDRGRRLNDFMVRRTVRDRERAADVIAGGVPLEVMDDALRELRALDPRRSLARVEVPTWLVNGQWDHFRLHERALAAALPSATVVRIPRANHLVSLTNPTAFDRVLLDAVDAVR